MPWSTRSLPQAPYASYAGQSLLSDRQPEAAESGHNEVPVWMGPLRHSEGMFSTFVHNNEQYGCGLAALKQVIESAKSFTTISMRYVDGVGFQAANEQAASSFQAFPWMNLWKALAE
eukprot:Skav212221  [mRNA]  locus=scaffold862:159187:160461:- [translate_table: standard]